MMKHNYEYIAHYIDGSVYKGEDFSRDKLSKLELISSKLPRISVSLEGKELIFYRRVVKNLMTNQIEKIIHFVGYRTNDIDFLLSVDSTTGVVRIEDDLQRLSRYTGRI